mmetsp:Transcript_12766/g.36446  ORF Transcript_12766/g.36446 Transcript_12766/m.36446 type:complete len:239 (-) Transcript_12766:1552-2268(-)
MSFTQPIPYMYSYLVTVNWGSLLIVISFESASKPASHHRNNNHGPSVRLLHHHFQPRGSAPPGRVCHRGHQQRRHLRRYPGPGRHRHGQREARHVRPPRPVQDLREDLQALRPRRLHRGRPDRGRQHPHRPGPPSRWPVLLPIRRGHPRRAARRARLQLQAGLYPVWRPPPLRRCLPLRRLRPPPRLPAVPVRPLRQLLRVEGHRHRGEQPGRQVPPQDGVRGQARGRRRRRGDEDRR